jgi:bacillithiol biosynthesis deacetylase BshB1
MNFPAKPLDVLVVAPHPDDAELGMGGGILQFRAEGLRVGILDLTDGEPTPNGTVEIRAEETVRASEVLGIDWRENLGLPNRSLEGTLEARRQLAEVFRQTRPRWLFAPYWVDAHPDHVAATELVEAARFWAKLSKSDMAGEPHHPERIYYYYSVHLKLAIQPSYILDITPYWAQKRQALSCYQSQFVADRSSPQGDFLDQIQVHAQHWGQLIGCQYGEPFASREPLGVKGFSEFI